MAADLQGKIAFIALFICGCSYCFWIAATATATATAPGSGGVKGVLSAKSRHLIPEPERL
jgi:hypothetical protein